MVVEDEDGCVIWDFCVEDDQDIVFSVNFEPNQVVAVATAAPVAAEEEEEEQEQEEEEKVVNATPSAAVHGGGVVLPPTRFLPNQCNAEHHVYGRCMPGRAGTVHLTWDNASSLVHGRTLSRIVEVVDRGMLAAAAAAAEEAEALEKARLEEVTRDDEVHRAMQLIQERVNQDGTEEDGADDNANGRGASGVSLAQSMFGGGSGGGAAAASAAKQERVRKLLTKRLESMEDMVATMMAKRDQSTAMMMMERQSRVETEFLLRDTHSRLESSRTNLSSARSECARLREELDAARAELSQQSSLATSRHERLLETEKSMIRLRRERDRLADEKRAWSFSKRDYERAVESEEARAMAELRDKVQDSEEARDDAQREVEEARGLQRGLQSQVVQLKVQLKVMADENDAARKTLVEALEVEREKMGKLSASCRTLSAQVSKYKTHKRVLVQELRKLRRHAHPDMSASVLDRRAGPAAAAALAKSTVLAPTVSIENRGGGGEDTGQQQGNQGAGGGGVLEEERELWGQGRGEDGKGPFTHIVGPGDNFHTISLQYGMTVLDIKKLNRLFGQNKLVLGTEIVVTPGSRARRQAEAAERAQTAEFPGGGPALQPRGWG